VRQVGFPLHDYIEMRGQQNTKFKKCFFLNFSTILQQQIIDFFLSSYSSDFGWTGTANMGHFLISLIGQYVCLRVSSIMANFF
jgi:hypothetical protein